MIRQIISHYRIQEKLGEGAFGAVYCAEDLKLKRLVAIKFSIAPSDDLTYRERFLREAQVASNLDHHPNIARIFAYGETPDGLQYIVMELVKGQTLQKVLLGGPLETEKSVEVICAIADALNEAHRQRVIHRDIKPGNVMLPDCGGVKVLDFGLAKRLKAEPESDDHPQPFSQTLTGKNIVMGTPSYMSPEQARGEKLDRRSDLFSLGAVFYECLTGVPPFSGEDSHKVRQHVIYSDPLPPSRINPQVSPELERIALKALAKSPDARYQSATELIVDLHPSPTKHELVALPSTEITDLSETESLPPQVAPPVFEPVPETQKIVAPAVPDQAHPSAPSVKRRSNLLPITAVLLTALLLSLTVWIVWGWATAGKLMAPKTQAGGFWYARGISALREGTYFQARKAFEKAVETENDFAPAHARLAEALIELGSPNEALNQLSVAGSLMPPNSQDSLDALYLKALNQTAALPRQLGDAIKTYQTIAERISRDDKWTALNDLGRAYKKAQDAKNAISSYRASLARKQQNPRAWLQLGVLYQHEFDKNQALDCFKKAEELYHSLSNHEGKAETLFERGVLLSLRGEPEEAMAAFEASLNLSRVNDKENAWQEVKTLLQQVSLADAKDPQAKVKAEQAIKLAEVPGLNSLAAHAHIELGGIYFVREEYEVAAKELEIALGIAERGQLRYAENRARLQLGAFHAQREDGDAALGFLQPALQFFQANGYRYEELNAYDQLGEVHLLRHDFASALAEFDRLLQTASQYDFPISVADAYLGRGRALFEQERYPEAVKNFREALARFEAAKSEDNVSYSEIVLADALWRLGDESSRATLGGFAPPPQDSSQDDSDADLLQLSIWLSLANLALSQPNLPQAIKLSGEVVNQCKKKVQQAKGNSNNALIRLLAEAQFTLGLAQSRGGKAAEGFRLCEEADLKAFTTKNKLLMAKAKSALAETALANNLPSLAFSAAKSAKEVFAELGLQDSEWRACLLAAEAAQKSGKLDNAPYYIDRAQELVAKLGHDWQDGFNGYLKRSDINDYKQRLDKISSNLQPSTQRSQK